MTKRANTKTKPQTNARHAVNFDLHKIDPLTPNQASAFKAYRNDMNLVLYGTAGTGKTFCALYLALQELTRPDSRYKRIVIIRSVVPSRDIGFLPGSMKEKIAVYEEPYRHTLSKLYGRDDAYENFKAKGLIQFAPTSFMRGVTLEDSIIIIDEAQNLEQHEVNTMMTRPGDNARIIICGDVKQTDLIKKYEKEGITQLLAITQKMKSFHHVEFGIPDIVRGGIVKEYIIACEKLGL